METTQKPPFRVINGFHGWNATSYENVKGKDWQISTMKTNNGKISSIAIQGEKHENGFTFEVFGGKRINLLSTTGKATEKAIREQHAKALIMFDEHPEVKEAIQAYEIKEGQILFLNGYGQDEHSHERKAVYKIEKTSFGVNYHCVNLENLSLTIQTHVKDIKDKFGIGTYYKEGDIIDLETLNNAVLDAKEKELKLNRLKLSEKLLNEGATAAKIEEGKKLVSIPSGAVAIIIGEFKEDESDSMTDYYGHQTVKTVYLAFSTHKKDLFPELRKAALNCPETKFLYDSPANFEHREKYSMGAGYYLGERRNSGWEVRKGWLDLTQEGAKERLYIAAAEGRYFANTPLVEEKETEVKTEGINLFIQEYSEKAGVIYGETKAIKDILKSAGCRFNMHLKINGQTVAGWVFPLSKIEEIKKITGFN